MDNTVLANLRNHLTQHWPSRLVGAVLAGSAGLILLHGFFGVGDALTRLSYDYPFVFGSKPPPKDVAIVYMDEHSHEVFDQKFNEPWDRALHAQLVDRLAEAGAVRIVFDIIFGGPAPMSNPQADEKLAAALKAHGGCVLAGDWVQRDIGGFPTEVLERPFSPLEEAAAAWGNARLPLDGDGAVRRGPISLEGLPSLSWAAARLAGAAMTQERMESPPNFWLKYYGPPGTIPSVRYDEVIQAPELLLGALKDRTVFVGALQSTDFSGKGKDEFATPFSRLTGMYSPGTEIHATAFLNLARRDWLRRFPGWLEILSVLLVGGAFGLALTYLRPLAASSVSVVAVGITLALAWALLAFGRVWFAWMICLVQIGVALSWSILFNSLRWYVERQVLVGSLESYLSPARARQVLRDPKLLQPGGEEQEVSILFSDIASYSKITGRMDTDDIFRLLNRYYEAALSCVHQTEGTVVQLIGDAIFAVWNAPIAQRDHQARACRAALLLRDQLVQFDASERSLPLRTRIGLHTGRACVGNLGSRQRFVYAAIGDSTNLSSRLEGLNKHLDTRILASRFIQKAVQEEIVSRLVGHFRFKGFDKVVEVHELIDSIAKQTESETWREAFGGALHAFQRKAFDEAEAGFRRTLELNGDDGPSRFYLEHMSVIRAQPLPGDWAGEVDLKEK